VRLLADSNIVAQAVRAIRTAGRDVVYVGERTTDPGDRALLTEAVTDRRVFLTKDHDIGALVHRDGQPHAVLLLVDDLGDARAETRMILAAIASHQHRLAAGAFLRATVIGTRETEE
jgi:predicted nuclease of predicted toxin-antitoxin system